MKTATIVALLAGVTTATTGVTMATTGAGTLPVASYSRGTAMYNPYTSSRAGFGFGSNPLLTYSLLGNGGGINTRDMMLLGGFGGFGGGYASSGYGYSPYRSRGGFGGMNPLLTYSLLGNNKKGSSSINTRDMVMLGGLGGSSGGFGGNSLLTYSLLGNNGGLNTRDLMLFGGLGGGFGGYTPYTPRYTSSYSPSVISSAGVGYPGARGIPAASAGVRYAGASPYVSRAAGVRYAGGGARAATGMPLPASSGIRAVAEAPAPVVFG